MADPATLPSADEFFGSSNSGAPAKLPTADEFFAPPDKAATQPGASPSLQPFQGTPLGLAATILSLPHSSQEIDDYMTHAPAGRILDAVGQGAKDGWGAEPMTWGDKTDEYLRKAGVFNDYKDGHAGLLKTFNEALLRPAAVSLATGAESVARGVEGAFGGVQASLHQGALEAGAPPKLAQDVAALPEAFPLYSELHADLATMRVMGVVGKDGERGWAGTVPPDGGAGPPPDIQAAAVKAEQARQAKEPEATGLPPEVKAETPREPVSPPDIHTVAAQINPDVTEYRALDARKDTYRRWIDELDASRRQQLATTPPPEVADLDLQIAQAQRKAANAGARMQGRYADQIEDLTAKRADALEDAAAADTPDMARVRKVLQETDYRMRDLAPGVSQAYREAEARMPQVDEVGAVDPMSETAVAPPYDPTKTNYPSTEFGGTHPVVLDTSTPSGQAAAAAIQKINEDTETLKSVSRNVSREIETTGPTSTPEMVQSIATDIFNKLVSAGRPVEEANIASQLAAQQVATRAERMGGKLGSARALYDREGPRIIAATQAEPRGAKREPEFASSKGGSITWKRGDVRPLIRLFRGNADASTFIHESGHQYLEELLRDAEHEHAPADLKADAATVRKWLGAEENAPIKRAGHEKFARGFERYLMEGRAPSKALASVFAKFKNWLTQIYQTVAKLKAPINDDIRAVFDRLLSANPEHTVVAPELPFEAGLGDRHEALAEETNPAKVFPLARKIRAERNEEVALNHPELTDELGYEGGGGGAGVGETPRPGADGGQPAAEPVAGEDGGVQASGAERAGGGQFKDEGARPRPEGARESGLYAKVGKEPKRLAEFIKSKGGVRDGGEDMAGVLSADRRSKGIAKKTGETLERMAESAKDGGYFPELGDRLPTPPELLAKLKEDLSGTAQYSDHDTAEVADYQAKLGQNHEVDRIANELAIDTKTMTRGEFWDKVAERLSEEKAFKEIESLDAARAADRGEIERDIEHHETQPEALEPEEIAAGRSDFGDVGPEQPGLSAGDERARQEPAGQGGRPGGAAGGAGPEGDAAGAGGGGTELVRARDADDPLIDKAGNIRLDNLNLPDDVDDALRQIARENNDFEADRFGPEGRQLHNTILAARKLTAQAMQEMTNARAKAALATATDADLLAYKEASNRLTMVARRLSTLTHQWGLAGQAFRMMEGLPSSAASITMADLAARTEGMTFNQLRQEAQLGLKLETPGQQLKFLNDARATTWDKARSMILELFVNSLISGPITHFAYTVGNEVTNLFRAGFESPIAAAVSAVRGRGAGERIYPGEIEALIYSHTKGAADGWAAAGKAWKTGLPEMLPGELDSLSPKQRADFEASRVPNSGAIPGKIGEIIRLPSDGVSAIHSFGRGITAAQELWKLAYRDGMDQGLARADLDRHIANFIDAPPAGTLEKVADAATRSVLMHRAQYGTAFYKLKAFVDSNLAAKLVAPFMQIGANLLHEGFMERTPLGLLNKTVRDNLLGRNGAIAQDMQTAKMITGITVSTAVVGLTLNGIVSGGGPSSPRQQAVLKATGWQPYSIKIGDRWVPYRKYLGYMGPLVAGVANMAEIGANVDHESLLHAAASAVGGLAEVVADESWFRGVSNFVNAARNYDRPEGERYLRDLAMDFVPFSVGLGQVSRAVDPFSRSVRSWSDALKAKIPGLSETLLPRRDVLGEPIASHSMITPTLERNEPVLSEMLKVEYYPSTISRKVRGVELTDHQYDDLARISGRMAKTTIQQYMAGPGWASFTAQVRHDMIESAFKGARDYARTTVIMNSLGGPNDIARQAMASKNKDLTVQR